VRLIKVAAGFGLLSAGMVMLVVPGPGWLTIAGGLALLAGEFSWARRALDSVKTAVRRGLPKDSNGYKDGKADRPSGDERTP